MSDDLYEQAYQIQSELKDLAKMMKEKEAELSELINEIITNKIQPIGYELRPSVTPSRVVNKDWFKVYEPEIYAKCVHVSHPSAVSIMVAICGDYRTFQNMIKEAQPQMFNENAVLTLSDVEKVVGKEEIDAIEQEGGITRSEVKSFKVVPLPEFQKNKNLKKMEGEA